MQITFICKNNDIVRLRISITRHFYYFHFATLRLETEEEEEGGGGEEEQREKKTGKTIQFHQARR